MAVSNSSDVLLLLPPNSKIARNNCTYTITKLYITWREGVYTCTFKVATVFARISAWASISFLALETRPQNETGLYSRPVSMKYLPVPATRSSGKGQYKPHHWQYPFQLSFQPRNVEKPLLTGKKNMQSLVLPHGRLATPLHNVKHYCHAHSWHPAFIQDPACIDFRAW